MIAFDENRFGSNAGMPAGTLQVTSTTKATPIPAAIETVVLFKCTLCPFQAKYEKDLSQHVKEKHNFDCEMCSDVFSS